MVGIRWGSPTIPDTNLIQVFHHQDIHIGKIRTRQSDRYYPEAQELSGKGLVDWQYRPPE
jgi:hypothetical protein